MIMKIFHEQMWVECIKLSRKRRLKASYESNSIADLNNYIVIQQHV